MVAPAKFRVWLRMARPRASLNWILAGLKETLALVKLASVSLLTRVWPAMGAGQLAPASVHRL